MMESDEISKLKYKGNRIPVLIQFLWAVLFVFAIYYMIKYSLPDLTGKWLK